MLTDKLPRVPYFTIADWYMTIAFVLLAFSGAQSMFLVRTQHHVDASAVDDWCMLFYAGTWIVSHFILAFTAKVVKGTCRLERAQSTGWIVDADRQKRLYTFDEKSKEYKVSVVEYSHRMSMA